MADIDYDKPPYAYRLEAIYPSKPGSLGLATAAVMSCIITGKTVSSYGGSSMFISPEVFEVLLRDREVEALIKTKVDELKFYLI